MSDVVPSTKNGARAACHAFDEALLRGFYPIHVIVCRLKTLEFEGDLRVPAYPQYPSVRARTAPRVRVAGRAGSDRSDGDEVLN